MILDSNGRPITDQVKQELRKNFEKDNKRKLNIEISAGGVEEKNSHDAELKSALITKMTQRRAKNKKTPIIQRHGKYKDAPEFGKEYPGAHPLVALRAMAWSSTVVYSILTYRRHQLTKREVIMRPKDEEPAFRFNILEYSPSEIMKHTAFDDIDKYAILEIFRKIDPYNENQRKLKKFDEVKDELSDKERKLIDYYNDKHLTFHRTRNEDKRNILSLLRNPDPYFSEESSWYYLLSNVLEDLLLIDRGALVKIRNDNGKIIALTPVDGITIRPYVDENGFITHYVQVVDGEPTREIIEKSDVILMRMNMSPDVYMYGYGVPNMDILWTTVLSDLYIDKGNVDYYRKGGSVPEGFLTVEPPGSDDDMYVQYDKEQLDGIQRQLQSIIMSDFTQVPLISGGKFNWIDLKGNRRDMQFKELAEYLTRKICAVFQVSPQDVGVLHDVNRSTSETQASMTKSKGLDTIAATVSHYITRSVVDEMREEKDLQLWFQEDDPDAIKDWWATVQGQLQTGYRSINEVKAEQGEDPVPWGDTPMQGLKNWNPEEALGQQQPGGPGGAPGGAPMPPGMDQVSEAGGGPSPVPIPGQMGGAAPSMGQAPAIKSVLTELMEPSFTETYKNLNVDPIIKNILGADTNLTTINDSLFTMDEPEVFESDITSSVEYFLKDAIRDIGLSFSSNELGPILHIKVPRTMYKKENFFKIAMYLMKFRDDSGVADISPDRATLRLYDVTVLPEIGEEGSYLHTVTSILKKMSFHGAIEVEFVTDEFDTYVIPVEEGDQVEDIIKRIDHQASLMSALQCIAVTEDLADIFLSKLEAMIEDGKIVNNYSHHTLFKAGVTKELSERALEIIEEYSKPVGEYYKTMYKLTKKHKKEDCICKWEPAEVHHDSDLADNIDAIVKAHKSERDKEQVYKEIFARLAFKYGGDMDNLHIAMTAIAYAPSITKEVSFEEGLERVEEVMQLSNKVNDTLRMYVDVPTEHRDPSMVGFAVHDMIDPEVELDVYGGVEVVGEEEQMLREEIAELLHGFSEFVYDLTRNPLTKITKKVETIVLNALDQTAMLVFMKLDKLDAIKTSVENILGYNEILIDIPLDSFEIVQDLDDVVAVATNYVLDEYELGDDEIVKSVVSKLIRDEDLDEFESTLLGMIRK